MSPQSGCYTMNRDFFSVLVLPILVVSYSSNTFSYERKQDAGGIEGGQLSSFAAQGIRRGSFILYPKLSIDQEYDSNIFKQDKLIGEVDSYVVHFKPGFLLTSDWSRHLLSLSVDTDITQYSTQGDANNYEEVFVDLTARLDVLRDSYLDAAFNYTSLHEDRGSPDQVGGSTPTVYDEKRIDLAYMHKFNRVSVKPAMLLLRADYEDTPTTSGLGDLKASTRSRWEYAPALKVSYEIQSGYEAFAEFKWREVSYDTAVVSGLSTNEFQRNSSGYNALAGIDFDLTNLVTGDISVGYLYRNYDDARLPTISGLNGFVNLLWRPTPLTRVNFNFSRDINETTQTGVAGVVSSSPGISIEHELMRNLIVTVGGNYSYSEYKGFDSTNATIANRLEREEDIYGANFAVKYLLNRNFSLGLNYNYDTREVNYTASDYEAHSVMLNINAQL